MSRKKNKFFPLPHDYDSLSKDGQRAARMYVLKKQNTPDDLVNAWALFRHFYLRPRGEAFYPAGFKQSSKFHYNMIWDLGRWSRNAQAAPRGFAKSTVIGIEAPLLLSLTRPYFHIGVGMATQNLIEGRFDKLMIEYVENPYIIADFGNMKPPYRGAIWNHHHLHLTNGSILEGFSIMGRKRGARPRLFILDDPEFDSEATGGAADSQYLITEKYEQILFRQIIPMLAHGASIFWIGTMINRRCLLYRACEGDDPRFAKAWNRRVYMAENSSRTESLWPAAWSLEFLRARESEIGSSAYCFTGDTLVYTPTGTKRIDSLTAEEQVFDGKRCPVTIKKVSKRKVDILYEITLQGYDRPLKCSDNHQFLVYEPTWYRSRFYNHQSRPMLTGKGNPAKIKLSDKLVWKAACDLKTSDICVFPFSRFSCSSYNPEFWWTIGRYLAEGFTRWIQPPGDSHRNQYLVSICANGQEYDLLQRTNKYLETTPWRGQKGPRRIYKKRNIFNLQIGSKGFATITKEFGCKAKDKHLTQEAKDLDYKNFMSLLDGYLSGDGYEERGFACANSISRQLLLDIKEALMKFGIRSYLSKIKPNHKEIICGEVYNCHSLYHLTIHNRKIDRASKIYFRKGLQYSKIRKVSVVDAPTTTVYDIETEGNFLVEGAIVHNSSEYLNSPLTDETKLLHVDSELNEYDIPNYGEMEPTEKAHLFSSSREVYWSERVKTKDKDGNIDFEIEKRHGQARKVFGSMYRVALVDTASGLESKNDFRCIAILGYDSINSLWVLDLWLGKVRDSAFHRKIYELGQKWLVRAIGIEACGTQGSLVESVNEYVDDFTRKLTEGQAERDVWVPRVVPIRYPVRMSKGERIARSLEWRFNAGKIKYPLHRSNEWPFSALYEQTENFTKDLALLRYDDAIDTVAMSGHLIHAKGRRPVIPTKKTLTDRIKSGEPLVQGLPLLSGMGSRDLSKAEVELLINAQVNEAFNHGNYKTRPKPNIIPS